MSRYLAFLVCVAGEPKVYSVAGPLFVSAPVGLEGGRIFGSVKLHQADPFAPNLLFVLSDEQYAEWEDFFSRKTYLDVSSRTSSFLKPFTKEVEFDVNLPEPNRYFVGVATGGVGELKIDWVQSSGNFLQSQYLPLAQTVRVMLALLVVFTIAYSVNFVFLPQATKLHLFYVATFFFTTAFLLAWSESLDFEAVTGQRNSWKTKWLPSLYQKGFDILEVLVYLLTALGWQSMREKLTYNEVQIIAGGALLSLLLGILEIRCGDDEIECGGYTSTRMVIHMFGYLTAIVGFNYHIAFLTSHVNEGSIASLETGAMYKHLSAFWWFRIVFLAFIIQPTLAVVLRADVLGWRDDWIFVSFFWITKIILLGAVALAFRPVKGNLKIVELAVRERRRAARRSSDS